MIGRDGKPNQQHGNRRLLVESQVVPNEEKIESEFEKRQKKILELIDSLGGNGTANIYRVTNGRNEWRGSLNLDEDVISNIEEKIANLHGGGHYNIQFKSGRTYMGSVTIVIDPAIKSESQREAEANAPKVAPTPTMGEIQLLITQTIQTMIQQMAPPRQDSSLLADFMKMQAEASAKVAAIQERNQDRLLEMMRSQHALAAPQPQQNLLEQVTTVGRLVSAVDDIRGGDRAPQTKGELVLGMLNKPLERVADRIADKFLNPTAPPPPKPTPVIRGVELPKRDPEKPLAIPVAARPLSQEELRNRREKSRTVEPSQASPPAPRVAQVMPERAAPVVVKSPSDMLVSSIGK